MTAATEPATDKSHSSFDADAGRTEGDAKLKISSRGAQAKFGGGAQPVHALGPFDLDVFDGEFVCLVGPSGCGKSTFIRLVAGLLKPTAGEISVWRDSSSRPLTAMVFQDFGIFPWKSVRANIMLALRATGMPKDEAGNRADHWLERLGLSDFADSYPSTLSGGMRQRVAIGRALAVEPEILLMDEPFAALDAQLREILQEELLELSQSTSQTVIFVTHSLDEALILGDRVVVMTARPGRQAAEFTVPFPRPRNVQVRESAEFAGLRGELWDRLRVEVTVQMQRRGSG